MLQVSRFIEKLVYSNNAEKTPKFAPKCRKIHLREYLKNTLVRECTRKVRVVISKRAREGHSIKGSVNPYKTDHPTKKYNCTTIGKYINTQQ